MTTSEAKCPICGAEPLGDVDASMSDRLAAARSAQQTGCGHQATELLLSLLAGAHAKGVESASDKVASVIITLNYTAEEEDGDKYYAGFVLSDGVDEPPFYRMSEPAESVTQAIVNLLVTMHDELLLGQAKAEQVH
ncbi:hypothetical protein UFOVP1287_10 [uncultured Caudovirales phage]|uniref:Uncharacterized protein n=1 Tax=uncultured Caudovirales phage TaxID=2100421 RepID=A0A6J5RMI3_9CAUD|nr:hypothetical protein UFOVP1287_10 [uncultured Caudovirales phage]CAB4205150.1 hypothetical protein UFOVP1408_30 [uncultured Caudovirales phage]